MKTMDNITTPNQKTIQWETSEFVYHPKTLVWFAIYGIISIGLLAFAIYTDSLITLIAFILLILITLFFAVQKPSEIDVELSELGIRVNQTFYYYKNITKFWINYNPGTVKNLHFETTAYINNVLKLELGHQDPTEVRKFLLNYLPEDLDRHEDIHDVIARKLRF